jgi:hypothetical protein
MIGMNSFQEKECEDDPDDGMKEYEDDGLTPSEDRKFKEIETGGKFCVAKGQDETECRTRSGT